MRWSGCCVAPIGPRTDRARRSRNPSPAPSRFGAYWRGAQVGFGRIVTDGVTIAWICDVVIDEAHRGAGLGKALVEAIVTHPEIAGLRQILATRDAHALYEQFGYERHGDIFLARNFRLPPAS